MGSLVTLKMLMFCNATQQRAGMFDVNRGGAGDGGAVVHSTHTTQYQKGE